MGYTITEVRETIKENAQGEQIEKKIVYHKKYIRPSEKAIKYFLENFDDKGYEVFPDSDVDDVDDDNEQEISIEEEVKENNDDYNDNHNDADYPLQCTCFQHTDVQGVKSEISESQDNIILPKTEIQTVAVVKTVEIVDPDIEKYAKFRKAVALVISESSIEIQKRVKKETDELPEVRADYLVGLPCAYAMRIASETYEDKKREYREKHNIPFEDYPVKPYPVTFNSDEGTRRMNVSYRERMHDIPLIEEAKALKKYIVAARMERYYEDLLIRHKCYYADMWD